MRTFVPSDTLIGLLVGGLLVENIKQVAREEIPNFLGNMCLATIGDGIEKVGDCYELCEENGDFLAGIGKMIIFRMGLNRLFISKERRSIDEPLYEDEVQFLHLLAQELRDHLKDHEFGNGRNRLEVDGVRLIVRKYEDDDPPLPRDPNWVQATVVKPKRSIG